MATVKYNQDGTPKRVQAVGEHDMILSDAVWRENKHTGDWNKFIVVKEHPRVQVILECEAQKPGRFMKELTDVAVITVDRAELYQAY